MRCREKRSSNVAFNLKGAVGFCRFPNELAYASQRKLAPLSHIQINVHQTPRRSQLPSAETRTDMVMILIPSFKGYHEMAKGHKSVDISVNNINFNIFQISFYTVWDGLSLKNISRYCPFND
jgi:hypothetical protein